MIMLSTMRGVLIPPAGGGFSPLDIAGLHAAFAANLITGLSDTDTVSAWNDYSGNSRNAIAPLGEEPTYRTGILNGLPVVRFSATNSKRLVTGSWTALSQPNTIFIVGTSRNVTYSQYFDGIASGNRHALFIRGNTALEAYSGSSAIAGVPDLTAPRIIQVLFNAGSGRVRVDGGSGTAISTGSHTLTGLTLGNRYASGFVSIGDLAEFLLYAGSLSLTASNMLGDYLAAKWGLSWSPAT